MAEVEHLTFKIDCEWACNLVRQRVYYEGVEFTEGLNLLKAMFQSLTDEDALCILTGTKKLVGINCGELVSDNKAKDYYDYVARKEEKARKDAIALDINVHPLNYIDPFATVWSPKKFEVLAREHGEFINVYELSEWLQQPPADTDTLFNGGMYPIHNEMHTFLIQSQDDKEKFFKQLYDFWNEQLKNKSFSKEDRKKIRFRQKNYEFWAEKNSKSLKQKTDEILEREGVKATKTSKRSSKRSASKQGGKRDKRPNWVIRDDNTYNLCEGSEAFYQRHAEYIPLDEGVFYDYGLIAPNGDFYACTFASHESAAVALARQFGYIQKDPDGHICIEDRLDIKDLLYERGWVYVNSGGNGVRTFYSKWGDIEDMPQRIMDTAYDYVVWERNKREEKE